jgi:hypothetical protein
MEILKASREWATRPADQRFTSLTELDAYCRTVRDSSVARVLPNRALEAHPVDGDNRAIMVTGPNGSAVDVSNWAFGQLAQRAGAPAGYLRELPAPIAADCINYGLRHNRDVEELGILLTKVRDRHDAPGFRTGTPQLRAVTGPNYGRIWDETVTRALIDQFGDGITGDFRVPGEFGKPVPVTRENTTLYASDRDLFVFLADEQHRIEIPNRRAGLMGTFARGVMFWNSEVGAGTLGYADFLYDYVCCNRIIWGAEQYREVRVRHTSGAPHRWLEEIVPAIEAHTSASTDGVVSIVAKAMKHKIDKLDEFLRSRFNGKQVEAIKAAHLADEQRPIETLWDATTAVTAYARGVQYQDQRVELERAGGAILALAA